MSDFRSVLSIVPRLSPAVDGVGDYALSLARQLRSDCGIDTCFLVCDPAWIGSAEIEGFCVVKISSRTAKSFAVQLPKARHKMPILLHYVGYGYAKRGCPLWLIDGLKCWKHQNPYAHLATMFHETSASGPIWTSAFWLSTLQISLVRRLVRISDRLITSKRLYADILKQIVTQQVSLHSDSRLPIPSLPVFSNVGEPKVVLPLNKRNRTLAVFGGPNTRIRVYQRCQRELIYVCNQFGLKKIIDIGPTNGLSFPKVGSFPVDVLGSKTALEISQIFSSTFAGFIDYPIDFLAKSGVFASYCAHSVLPIVRGAQGLDADGLISQHHFWHLNSTHLSIDESIAQTIASNAYIWYQSHNLAIQAEQFAHSLTSNKLRG